MATTSSTALFTIQPALEPEVRDWLDSLTDSDYKRVGEVCGLLAEQGTEPGGPWSDHREGPVWELRIRLREVAALFCAGREGGLACR